MSLSSQVLDQDGIDCLVNLVFKVLQEKNARLAAFSFVHFVHVFMVGPDSSIHVQHVSPRTISLNSTLSVDC